MFSLKSKLSLAQATLLQNKPVYVQFYITARCNLTCEQCNIIYSNADLAECNIYDIENIAENLAKIGVAIILLTGGEPFARKDLPQIIKAFEDRGIHVRMQTNGFASEKQIEECIKAGGKDISISLDSLEPLNQDKINGGFSKSWHKALETISLFTKYLPKENSFASLGCVLQPLNIDQVTNVIKFGTEIGWFTSLVPIHVTNNAKPRGFRTFNQSLKFKEEEYKKVIDLLKKVREMKRDGYLLYDSEKYLENIQLFIENKPLNWREKNQNICDSPNLYFAILPNGEFAPCCDFRTENTYLTSNENFTKNFSSNSFKDEVKEITSSCEGCMYGSYPEISISMRYIGAKLQRINNFFMKKPKKNWPISYEKLINIAESINSNAKEN